MREELLAWYDANKRDLPWRRTTDPYPVLVSELMLQQTRVGVVVPKFEAWMRTFPTVEALAAASEEQVMAAWSGLGYYRRAKALHGAAKHVKLDGWPRTAQALRALPGVGPYTAAAVASIAFGEPVGAVDGNVMRVLARVHGLREQADKGPGRKQIQAWADGLAHGPRPGDWTQALMEFGATVCAPKPACEACALDCASRGDASIPVLAKRTKPVAEVWRFARIVCGGAVLLERRKGLLGGTWMLPGIQGSKQELRRHVESLAGAPIDLGPAASAKHVFSHRAWTMRVHEGKAAKRFPAAPPFAWVPLDALTAVGTSTALRKALAALS